MATAQRTQTRLAKTSWCLVFVVALQATTAWARKEKRMDFKTARLGTFERSPCSPALDAKAKEGLRFNMPKQIAWGAPLPICGVVKTSNERQPKPLAVRIYVDFAQPLSNNQQLMGMLVEEGSTPPAEPGSLFYFNVDGLGPMAWAALPPGDYQVRLDADFGLLASPTLPLRITDAGWRKDLAAALVQHACKRHLLTDLDPYFKYLDLLGIETPASPAAAEASQARLREKWRAGFAAHAAMLTPKVRDGLRATAKPDPGLAEHVWHMMQKQCPKQRPDEARRLDELVGAMKEYEIER